MLSLLRVQNLAIIEESEISFSPGLNVLSGETGAGKSILLEAIELLCGKRANADLVRAGTERCVIEAELQLPDEKRRLVRALVPALEEEELDALQLRRVIDAQGKSRCFINGALSNLKQLQGVSELLLDVTRQHTQQILLRETEHRQLLDEYGVDPALLQKVADDFAAFSQARTRLEHFRSNSAERAERMRRIRAEHEELSEAALRPEEREEVEEELSREANGETLLTISNECLELLSEGEDAVERKLKRVRNLLEQANTLDSRLDEIRQLVETASIELSEAALSYAEYQSSLESDPQHLESLRERLALIARLERKYGRPCAELCIYAEQIGQELADFDSGSFDEQALSAALTGARKTLDRSEAALHAARIAAGAALSSQVEKQLAKLNMKKARFAVLIEASASSVHGADRVSFQLAANPGEPLQSLAKVASGGELSRLLLVLKSLLADQMTPLLHVFDEIDSGIGGAVAQVVGEKLQSLARKSQVIVVTHAPQVAALADCHIVVEKRVLEGRTHSSNRVLSLEERVQHLAAMLAGKNVTASFEESARQLLGISSATAPKKRANQ